MPNSSFLLLSSFIFVFFLLFSLIVLVYETKFLIGFKKYLFKTKENTKITIPIKIAVLNIKVFLSSIAALISLAFSVIAKYPILFPYSKLYFL